MPLELKPLYRIFIAWASVPHPSTTARLYPCPWCVEHNPLTGTFRNLPKLTRCTTCRDMKAVVIAGNWPNVLLLIPPPGGRSKGRAGDPDAVGGDPALQEAKIQGNPGA